MRYLQLALLLLTALAGQEQVQAKEAVTLRDRLSDARERVVRRVSSWLVFWSGTTREDKLKRLDYYQRLLENVDNGGVLKNWKLYKKRWYPWIVDGKMPIKNPDGCLSDARFLDYVVQVEELIADRALTQEEKEFACFAALEEVGQYRKEKGIR